MRLLKIIVIILRLSFQWSKTTIDQRKEVVSEFLSVYASHVSFRISTLPKGNWFGRCRKIEPSLFNWFKMSNLFGGKEKPEYIMDINFHRMALEVLETVLHEYRHVEQELENPKAFAGYKTVEDFGFKAYYSQDVEVDARRYAKEKCNSWEVIELLWDAFKKVVK